MNRKIYDNELINPYDEAVRKKNEIAERKILHVLISFGHRAKGVWVCNCAEKEWLYYNDTAFSLVATKICIMADAKTYKEKDEIVDKIWLAIVNRVEKRLPIITPDNADKAADIGNRAFSRFINKLNIKIAGPAVSKFMYIWDL